MPKKKTETNKNMELWEQVCETNPAITKRVNARGGFTSIDAQSQVKRATELWGPFGHNWGLKDLVFGYTPIDKDGKNPGVNLRATFYYSTIDEMVFCSFPIASDMSYKPTDDCFKKLQTDCITKALSRLGFNSDVFEGKFDDNKYVAEMEQKYNSKPVVKKTVKPSVSGGKEKEKAMVRLIFDAYLEDCPEGMVVDMAKLKKAILDKYGKLPTKEASVNKVVQEIPIEDVIQPNDFIEGIE